MFKRVYVADPVTGFSQRCRVGQNVGIIYFNLALHCKVCIHTYKTTHVHKCMLIHRGTHTSIATYFYIPR